MADRISFHLEDENGDPITGLLPEPSSDWVTEYRVAVGGAQRTKPLVSEIGGGEYGLSPTDADEAAGVVFLITVPEGYSPRRYSGAIHTPTNPFIGFHLEDDAGDLWAGDPSTVAVWSDFTPSARTPPAVLTPGGLAYLFAVVPSAADLTVDVAFRIESPPGALPERVTGSLEAQPWVAPSPGPLKDPAADVAAFLDSKTAGATVLALAGNLFIGKLPSQDKASVSPCVAVRNTGGPPPAPYLNGHRDALYRPTVQVMVRGPAGDDRAGELVARELLAWLNLQVRAGYITWNVRESAPNHLGTDKNQHGQWSFNLEALYRVRLD